MLLAPGTRLGPFEILAPIGAEVYRAKDSKLKREVALKVLPDSFADDPERMTRFQREAEMLATLNDCCATFSPDGKWLAWQVDDLEQRRTTAVLVAKEPRVVLSIRQPDHGREIQG